MAHKALGTKLKIGANSIADLTSIGGVEITVDTIDISNLDNTFRTFIDSIADGGEVSFSGFFDPSDTNGQNALYDNILDGAVAMSILFPATLGAEWSFDAIVTSYATSADLEDAITFEGTLKITGEPTLGVTPSTGLSALSLTGTGGSLSPAFGAAIEYYTFGGVTAASITVTATAATHTLKLYVDGVFTQTLTSGSASSAIAMSIGSKKLTILATESGKTTEVTEIVVVKVS